ncbi:histidine triad nucleotide-binding protein [Allokutzneria oryzae]|uniref:Histidine triad nucleotide-binding protein n=1 Tax=Allokutzneria oryzae TaxID=1378989 RepID=A0ABV6A7V8_9PSEU
MSAAGSDCLFCRIAVGEIPAKIVHESENVLAFRDINPQAPTHVLVIPREHYPHAAALAAGRPEVVAELVVAAGVVAEQEGIAESGYRLLFNTGEQAGQTVFHAHLHVLGGEWLGGLVGGELR